MAKKLIYKTVIQVTVLSDTPLTHMSLSDVAYVIEDGDCSGQVEWKPSKILVGKAAAKAVQAQGSDPEFFQMDEDGNELED
jgi:hypothetical protein